MSLIGLFAAYAQEFEKAYDSDVWLEVEACFSDDVVYEIGLPILGATRCEGRTEVLVWFKTVLDGFDRRFGSRELKLLEGPKEENGEVWIRGMATYRTPGLPDFVLELEETVRFENGKIVHLEDRYTDEMAEQTRSYLLDHAETLGIVVESMVGEGTTVRLVLPVPS